MLKLYYQASLVVQCLKLLLPIQEDQTRSLVMGLEPT